MRARLTVWLSFSALTIAPAALATAQVPAQAVPQARLPAPVTRTNAQVPPLAVPGAPAQAVPQAAAPTPAPPPRPPAFWTPADANALLMAIGDSAKEGLDPSDYDSAGLIAALKTNNPALVSAAATERFNKLSSDMALGHVRGADRQNWHIPDPDLDAAKQDLLLRTALSQHRVNEALRGLLPTHPQYLALRNALAVTP